MMKYDKIIQLQDVNTEIFSPPSPPQMNYFIAISVPVDVSTVPPLLSYGLPYNTGDFQLFAIRWEDRSNVLLCFQCITLSKKFWRTNELVTVYLGRKDFLDCGDFQISGMIYRNEAEALLKKGVTLQQLVGAFLRQGSELKKLKERADNRDIPPQINIFYEKIHPEAPRRILASEITLEAICFDPDRIMKFFDYSLLYRPDFFLTYGNGDLCNALAGGEEKLSEFLQYTPTVGVGSILYRAFSFFSQETHHGRDYYRKSFQHDPRVFAFRDDPLAGVRYFSASFMGLTPVNAILFLQNELLRQNKNAKTFYHFLRFLHNYDKKLFIGNNALYCVQEIVCLFREAWPLCFPHEKFFSALGFFAQMRPSDRALYFFRLGEDSNPSVEIPICYPRTILDHVMILLEARKSIENQDLSAVEKLQQKYECFCRFYTFAKFMEMQYSGYDNIRCAIEQIEESLSLLQQDELKKFIDKNTASYSVEQLDALQHALFSSKEFKWRDGEECIPVVTTRPPQAHEGEFQKEFTRRCWEKAAQDEERLEILRVMHHNIKSLTSAMACSIEQVATQIEEISRVPSGVLRELASARVQSDYIKRLALNFDLATKEPPLNWREDITNPPDDARTLQDILYEALRSSLPALWDGWFYSDIASGYFREQDHLMVDAERDYSQVQNMDQVLSFIDRYFTPISLRVAPGLLSAKVGDSFKTEIRLFVLFQEIFSNALKYSAFVQKEKRAIHIFIAPCLTGWRIVVNNRYNPSMVRNKGNGRYIISNLLQRLKAHIPPYALRSKEIYSVRFVLPLK